MVDKAKKKVNSVKISTNTVLANTQQLLASIAMIVCAYYNYSTISITSNISDFEYYIRLGSSIVLAFLAALAYWYHAVRERGN